MPEQRISPFLNNPPLIQPLLFYKKYFIPTLIVKLRMRGEGGGGVELQEENMHEDLMNQVF